MKNTKS